MNRNDLLNKVAMELDKWPVRKKGGISPACPDPDWRWCRPKGSRWVLMPKSDSPLNENLVIRENQWHQRRAELINRPPDSEAPEWARWVAQSPSGHWEAFSVKPKTEEVWAYIEGNPGAKGVIVCYGKIPAGHDWTQTLTEIKPVQRELKPTTSSLTDSQAREYAETTGECSDGKRCGVPPKVGDDAYCADCPNQPTPEEDEAFNAMSAKQEQPHETDARMLDAQLMADMQTRGVCASSILSYAAQHMQDRAATYDKPEGERSMLANVEAFAATTGVSLTEEQGWHFMALLKLVRSQQGDYRADSYEDGAAYFALMGEAAAKERKK